MVTIPNGSEAMEQPGQGPWVILALESTVILISSQPASDKA